MVRVSCNILEAMFNRNYAGEKYTKIICGKDYDIPICPTIDGNLVLLYYKNEDEWFCLSDEMFEFKVFGKKVSYRLNIFTHSKFAVKLEVKEGNSNKKDWSRLEVLDLNGNSIIIPVEKGKYVGTNRVLNFLIQKQKK